MKKKFSTKILSVCCLITVIFNCLGCKHRKPQPDNQAPDLKLVSMFIHGKEVKNSKVIIEEYEINSGDIRAYFNYGSAENQIIDVTVKGSVFTVDEAKPKKLELSVKALKGIHGAWQGSVEVSYINNGNTVDKDLASYLKIKTGKENGKDISALEEDTAKILDGKNITIALKGPKATLEIGGQKETWTSLTVNGNNVAFAPKQLPKIKLLSYSSFSVDLPESESCVPVKINIEAGTKKSELRFKIRRVKGMIDVPKLYLLVDEIFVTEKDTPEKLADGSLPGFKAGGEPSKIEIRCMENEMASVTVNSENAEIKTKEITTLDGKKNIQYIEAFIRDITPEGKEVSVTVNPVNTADYHSVVWKFKITCEAPSPVHVLYTINRKTIRELGSDFVEQAENGSNPVLNIQSSLMNIELNYLNTQLKEIKINEYSITGSDLNWDGAFGGVVFHTVKIGAEEKQITITLIPKDKPKYEDKVIKFRAKGNGGKEKISAKLELGEYDLPSDFIGHISDGSNPVYKVFGNAVPLKISVDEYTFNCLCNKIKLSDGVNEETLNINAVKKSFTVTHYYAEKDIDITTPKTLTISFIAKYPDTAETAPWKFTLETGGNKPAIPKDKIYALTINRKGVPNNPLPATFTAHLTDGTKPLYVIDSPKANVALLWREPTNDIVEKVVFKIDGVKASEKTPVFAKPFYGSAHAFSLEQVKPKEYEIEVVIIPKPAANYEPLVYSFKLQNSGLNPELPIQFGYDNQLVEETGEEDVISIETVEVFVQSFEDVMGSVTMDGKLCPIKKIEYRPGKFAYKAVSDILLPADNAKDVRISVKPKNSGKYRDTECTYKLKGTAVPASNAEFQYLNQLKPNINNDIEWADGNEHKYNDDYGAKNVILTAKTVSPRAEVWYKPVGIKYTQNSDGTETAEEVELAAPVKMTREAAGVIHTSAKIILQDSKPSFIKVWVKAEDGSLNDQRGMRLITYNPAFLRWDYQAKNKGEEFSCSAYDVIKIDKAKVSENKIHLAFSIWDTTFGYQVKDSKFVKRNKNKEDDNYRWYTFEADISALTESNPVTVELPIYQDGGKLLCFTYRVKLELKHR